MLRMQTVTPATLPASYLIQEQKSFFGSAALQKASRSPSLFLIPSTWAEEREKPRVLCAGPTSSAALVTPPCLSPVARKGASASRDRGS